MRMAPPSLANSYSKYSILGDLLLIAAAVRFPSVFRHDLHTITLPRWRSGALLTLVTECRRLLYCSLCTGKTRAR
jgi:hypothetical protein